MRNTVEIVCFYSNVLQLGNYTRKWICSEYCALTIFFYAMKKSLESSFTWVLCLKKLCFHNFVAKTKKVYLNGSDVLHRVQSRRKIFNNNKCMNNSLKKKASLVHFYCMSILIDHSVIQYLRSYSILFKFSWLEFLWKVQGRYNREHLAPQTHDSIFFFNLI